MLAFLIIVLIAGLLIYAVMLGGAKPKPAGRRAGGRSVDRDEIRVRWEAILASSKAGGLGLKSAVTDADKLLDYVMKTKGYRGATMADRLRSAGPDLKNRDAVWRAHKLRNVIAHEVNFDLVATQAQDALRGFEHGLRDLGAL